jgi:diguanylate cyclase (GGDEF)-like protein
LAPDVSPAHQDPLTGLPHRHDFMERLDAWLQADASASCAIFVLDLTGFRTVVQQRGPIIADRILIEFATRVTALLDDGDVLAYLGEDDFAVLQPHTANLDKPTRLAQRIVAAMDKPFMAAPTIRLGVTVGIAIAPDDGRRADELIRRATLTHQRTRDPFASTVRYYEKTMDAVIDRHARIREYLPQAISRGEITVQYQPIVALTDKRILAFEALARWQPANLGTVEPELFFRIAAEQGLLRDLNAALLRQAARDARTWPTHVRLCFNLASDHFLDRALGLHLLALLGAENLSPARVIFDIEACAFHDDAALAHVLVEELRAVGAGIALSGTGTHAASLPDLVTIRFDRLKISRDIVHRLGADPTAVTMVRTLADFAHALGVQLVAQGIETRDQCRLLQEAGCDAGQGYFLGRPARAHQVGALLQSTRTRQKSRRVHTSSLRS